MSAAIASCHAQETVLTWTWCQNGTTQLDTSNLACCTDAFPIHVSSRVQNALAISEKFQMHIVSEQLYTHTWGRKAIDSVDVP